MMPKCPYSETILDESSGIEVTNDQYINWQQGYEAFLCENAKRLKNLGALIQELKDEIAAVKPGDELSATKD